MAHDISHENLSPEEKKYQELVSRGDDYHRIELYRWSLRYYKTAQAMHIHDDTLQGKMDIVSGKIKNETRIILTVLAVAAVIIAAVMLLT